MAKFNEKTEGIKTTNICGYDAYSMTDKETLVTQVLTSFMNEPKYYGDNSNDMISLACSVASFDGEFVAKLAKYTRTVMNMRSTSHMLCAVLAHEVKGKTYVRNTICDCVVRGDDVTEILSAYMQIFEDEPIPNSLRRGLKDAIDKLDDYSIAKYQSKKSDVKMADAIKICHANRRKGVTDACIENTLDVPVSWETELSAKGNNKETWEYLIEEDKIPYMAALRNLRNIINANPDNLSKIVDKIGNEDFIKNSKQLPFRFYSAYESVANIASSAVFDALNTALNTSVQNYPRLAGKTVIAVDTSGSMNYKLSRKGSVTYADVAALLGICAAKLSDECWVYTFDNVARKASISTTGDILGQMSNLRGCGGMTNMKSVFDTITKANIDCDRIIILSDNEVNYDDNWAENSGRKCIQSCADAYRRHVGHDVWVHAADMAGYGTCQFVGKNTNIIAGWSEKILNFIPMAEEGVSSLLDEIDNVVLR